MSPVTIFVFMLVMSVLFRDIKRELNTPKQQESIPEVLYADDTLTFGNHTASINKLLASIERESWYYNMKLNYTKCVIKKTHVNNHILRSIKSAKAKPCYLPRLIVGGHSR